MPAYWKSKEAETWVEGCRMVLDGTMSRMEGSFSVASVAFLGSLVVQQCIATQKEAFGGRFVMESGWVVDVIGNADLRPPVVMKPAPVG